MSKLKNIMITLAALVAMTSYSFAFEGLSIGTVYTDADFSTSGSETTDAGGGVLQKKSTSKSGSIASTPWTREASNNVTSPTSEISSIFIFLPLLVINTAPPFW